MPSRRLSSVYGFGYGPASVCGTMSTVLYCFIDNARYLCSCVLRLRSFVIYNIILYCCISMDRFTIYHCRGTKATMRFLLFVFVCEYCLYCVLPYCRTATHSQNTIVSFLIVHNIQVYSCGYALHARRVSYTQFAQLTHHRY